MLLGRSLNRSHEFDCDVLQREFATFVVDLHVDLCRFVRSVGVLLKVESHARNALANAATG